MWLLRTNITILLWRRVYLCALEPLHARANNFQASRFFLRRSYYMINYQGKSKQKHLTYIFFITMKSDGKVKNKNKFKGVGPWRAWDTNKENSSPMIGSNVPYRPDFKQQARPECLPFILSTVFIFDGLVDRRWVTGVECPPTWTQLSHGQTVVCNV